MKLLTFKGGIHPPYGKEYANKKPIERAKAPATVYIPLQQHIGAPAKCIVEVGDEVKLGQKIGEAQGFVSSNIHSSVSGVVKAIKECGVPGGTAMCVVIENDFKEELHENVKPHGEIEDLSREEIVAIIKEAGIVGMGGATFPNHVKVSPPPDSKAEYVILNGAECEPYLTADDRLMVEYPETVVYGLRVLMKVLDVKKGFIGIEVNKPEAIKNMVEAASAYPEIEVVSLQVKYPEGAEKQLIYACTGREVPSGALPIAAGAVVDNVATSAAIARAIKEGMPLVERITTITGPCIKEPKNLITKVGTKFSEIIEQCGGVKEGVKASKLIAGGPMMGLAQFTDDISTNKGSSGILILDEEMATAPEPMNCIKCGRCTDVCPAFLQPLFISAYSLKNNFDEAEKHRAMDCIECGSCSYICPSRRLLLPSIRQAKREIGAKRRKAAAAQKK
ncbi:electron transporter RnfC [Peptostreptococcus russellii]|uniref:Ion-translocating oxidoreductase complex subunit C n=1 Tax=Peptostreptococcus russellii TaxID=215200 RepID=A0A2P7Q0C4_9FIRM|nr:electron transport complex subunit RsxC [Peptostreptococcus russellii]PSJ31415.1 electron transporter RnfC [Peptostreptococcus russellii]